MDSNRSISTRQVAIRSAGLVLFSAALVTVYWWLKGFRLRLVGDAVPSLKACSDIFAEANPLKFAFQIPYCGVVEVASVRTWIIIQILLWAIAVVFIYRAGALLFDETTGLLAGVATACLWETFRFALRPQSDLMLLFAVAVAFWAMSRHIQFGTRRSWLLVTGSLLFVGFSKALGFPLVFAWVVWTALPLDKESSLSLRPTSLPSLGLYVGLVLFTLYIAFLYFIPRFTRAVPESGIHWRTGFAGAWWNGIVATHFPVPTFEYIYQPREAATMLSWIVVNFDHVVVMGLLRMAFFFVPILPRWSTFHIVVNLFTIIPMTVGMVLGARQLLLENKYSIAGLLLAPIFASLITVSLVYVDGGFNYRAPATLAFALLSAYWLRTSIDKQLWKSYYPSRID